MFVSEASASDLPSSIWNWWWLFNIRCFHIPSIPYRWRKEEVDAGKSPSIQEIFEQISDFCAWCSDRLLISLSRLSQAGKLSFLFRMFLILTFLQQYGIVGNFFYQKLLLVKKVTINSILLKKGQYQTHAKLGTT